MSHLRLVSLALIAVFSTMTLAAAQTATPVPNPKTDWSSMNFLLGTWQCATVMNTTGRGSGRTETYVYTMTLDDHYMLLNGTSKPFDAARTSTLLQQLWIGYDSVKKAWYSFNISNFGGFSLSTSPGWNGNKSVWTDTYNSDGQPLSVTTVTKVSDTKMTVTNVTKSATETSSQECAKS